MPARIGTLDAGQVAALAEVVEVAVVEEQLRADVVGAGVHLSLEVVHLLEAVRRAGVAFGEAGHADAEAARVAAVVVRPDEAHQPLGVAEGVLGAVVVRAGRAAGRRPGRGCSRSPKPRSGRGWRPARRCVWQTQVRCETAVRLGLAVDADDEVVGAFARRAAGAVGDGDERRLQLLQAGDVGEQLLGRLVGLRREELEAERGARAGGRCPECAWVIASQDWAAYQAEDGSDRLLVREDCGVFGTSLPRRKRETPRRYPCRAPGRSLVQFGRSLTPPRRGCRPRS